VSQLTVVYRMPGVPDETGTVDAAVWLCRELIDDGNDDWGMCSGTAPLDGVLSCGHTGEVAPGYVGHMSNGQAFTVRLNGTTHPH
jgi:hypothetical protein